MGFYPLFMTKARVRFPRQSLKRWVIGLLVQSTRGFSALWLFRILSGNDSLQERIDLRLKNRLRHAGSFCAEFGLFDSALE